MENADERARPRLANSEEGDGRDEASREKRERRRGDVSRVKFLTS